MTDYADPRQAAAAYDRQIRDLMADVVELCAVRDADRHMVTLLDARDTAKASLDAAVAAAEKAATDLDATVKAEARAAQRTAEARVAVTRAQAEHERAKRSGTADQETAARATLEGQRETLASREQTEAERHGERQAAALAADRARGEIPGLELEHAARESAVACPGRAPVSHGTLEVISHMYAQAYPPAGLPSLSVDEQQQRYGILWAAYTHPSIRPEYQVTAADFQDVRLQMSRA